MAALGLFYYMWTFSSCGEQGPILCCDARASHWWLFLATQTLGAWASAVVVIGLRCSTACGIFLDQG